MARVSERTLLQSFKFGFSLSPQLGFSISPSSQSPSRLWVSECISFFYVQFRWNLFRLKIDTNGQNIEYTTVYSNDMDIAFSGKRPKKSECQILWSTTELGNFCASDWLDFILGVNDFWHWEDIWTVNVQFNRSNYYTIFLLCKLNNKNPLSVHHQESRQISLRIAL